MKHNTYMYTQSLSLYIYIYIYTYIYIYIYTYVPLVAVNCQSAAWLRPGHADEACPAGLWRSHIIRVFQEYC